MTPDERAILAVRLWDSAVMAAQPYDAVLRAVATSPPRAVSGRRGRWVLSLGKAAALMARAAVDALRSNLEPVEGGIVVDTIGAPSPHRAIRAFAGDHPTPGARSAAAANALGEIVARVAADDDVLVLLSGGASSLVAAPIDGIGRADLAALNALLLGSGLDIAAMNSVRKRFSRWSAGRLARALAPARVLCFAISDVPDDDLATIGSGPCVGDPSRATDVIQRLERAGLWSRVPASMRAWLAAAVDDPREETPKPGDLAFAHVDARILLSNRDALFGAAALARERGCRWTIAARPIGGEASALGQQIAARLIAWSTERQARPRCLLWGGEPTVDLGGSLPDESLGGRAQELALATARVLHDGGAAGAGITVLAAGTDGRDGPTDAAGAIVDSETWSKIARAGRDPAHDLEHHRSYAALDAGGALLRCGATGTNVMDVVVGIVS